MPTLTAIQKNNNKVSGFFFLNHMSCVTYQVLHVTCHLASVINPNSHSHRPYPSLCSKSLPVFLLVICSLTRSIQSIRNQVLRRGRQTHNMRHTDMATYRLNRPRGRVSESSNTSLTLTLIFKTPETPLKKTCNTPLLHQ